MGDLPGRGGCAGAKSILRNVCITHLPTQSEEIREPATSFWRQRLALTSCLSIYQPSSCHFLFVLFSFLFYPTACLKAKSPHKLYKKIVDCNLEMLLLLKNIEYAFLLTILLSKN